jgi:hypothetical protein
MSSKFLTLLFLFTSGECDPDRIQTFLLKQQKP